MLYSVGIMCYNQLGGYVMKAYKKYVMDKNIRVYRQKGYQQPPHLHDFLEFVYIINGKSVHVVDNIEYAVSKGDLVIINYNQFHSFSSDKNSEHFNILIKPEFVDTQIKNRDDVFALLDVSGYESFKNLVDKGKRTVTFSPEERKRFESIMFLLEKELQNQDSGYEITTRSCTNLMLAMIFRKMSQKATYSENIINNEILHYIKEHCDEKLTIEMFSAKGHYNPSYFSRSFKKYTGVTFTEYLKQARMSRACELILNTKNKIDDIYTKVGYTDKTKFFKHFKEYTNTTPLKYRKSQNQILFDVIKHPFI